ncbi:non-hydrolyzing UDP-N-acetylglucosamine 2-epimerase [Streptomyces netropsis]|uniref:UDP-N-acetylglucosamine 2-epimerase (non-hydrolyzing) n=1 Tax=Streptomyces netropsis TaxID=55404 RepID=A0A7W7PES9_STRNE|nr:UDP-N-acetylglucosamine 2-epimerase (non-hydrolyzing) [Streptomyces netropsis]MBB4888186.1 UDP-N-acetylglucosamine 2-epimerase (non-hydrolyzing) [Streptomyces netropsis]GGR31409.1 UDP-N-acetyl glucosamine 2-epimerase [Streptomyces netropsis]
MHPDSIDEDREEQNGRHRIALVVGTRPEAVKLAPVALALSRSGWAEPVVITTGQHGEVVRETLSCFGLRPDIELTVRRGSGSVAELTGSLLSGLDTTFRSHPVGAVVVQGDTSSALAGAMAGFFSSIPVAHVEAGLRSGDLRSPFPEEAHRRMIAQVTELHLAPTRAARDNLLTEGVAAERIRITGNTVIDAVVEASRRPSASGDPVLRGIAESGTPLVLVTAHRRENWGEPIRRISGAVADLSRRYPDITFVVAAHMNPSVRAATEQSLHGIPNVRLTGPIPYGPFARILARSMLTITDSGGIQEEAAAFGVPVLVTRDNTERIEGIASGLARLVGTEESEIVAAVEKEFAREDAFPPTGIRPVVPTNPYGDGRAGERCAAACGRLLGIRPFHTS